MALRLALIEPLVLRWLLEWLILALLLEWWVLSVLLEALILHESDRRGFLVYHRRCGHARVSRGGPEVRRHRYGDSRHRGRPSS